MTDLTTLSRRVSEAEGPSRELDAEIAEALGWSTFMLGGAGLCWKSPDGHIHAGPPEWTRSLDAVVALIAEKLPGFKWSLHKSGSPYIAGVTKEAPVRTMPHMGVAKTPALALLSAALLAIHERKEP